MWVEDITEKSTLLRALEDGVYDYHIGGDGREFVITDPSAVKIRAEDGRSVWHIPILSLFIRVLPTDGIPRCFTTTECQRQHLPGRQCGGGHGGRSQSAADG